MLSATIAYKYVVILAMISRVNYYAPRMQLPIAVPINKANIKCLDIMPPNINTPGLSIYGGRIQVDNYSFTFGDKALLVYNLDQYGYISFGIPMGEKETAHSGMERASRMTYTVNTNDLYRMATNVLVALDVNVSALEREDPPVINKNPFFKSERGLVPSPLMTVEWQKVNAHGFDRDRVELVMSAVSGELLKYIDLGGSFRNGNRPFLNNVSALLAISDEEFMKYSSLDRSNLLVNYAGIHCSDLHCPSVDDTFLLETNTGVRPDQIKSAVIK